MTDSYPNPGRGGGSYKVPHARHQNAHNRHQQQLSNGPNSYQQPPSRVKYPQSYPNPPFPTQSTQSYDSSSQLPAEQISKAPHNQNIPSAKSPNPATNSLPTHPVGFSKSTPSPDMQPTEQNSVNPSESLPHLGNNNPLPLDSPVLSPVNHESSLSLAPKAPFPLPNSQTPATNTGGATLLNPAEEASPLTDPFPPVNTEESSEPLLPESQTEDTPLPPETDPAPPSAPPPPSYSNIESADQQQQGAHNQMNAMMSNMYMNHMFMNPWMAMMPWMSFYPYQGMQSFLQAQTQAYQQNQAYPPQYQQASSDAAAVPSQEKMSPSATDPLLSSDCPSEHIPHPPPDTPELVSQMENLASAPDTSEETLPPPSCSSDPPASNTQSSSPASIRQQTKLSHSSLTEEALDYDAGPAYPPESSQEAQVTTHPDVGMGQLGVTVGSSTLANCTNFGNWPNISGPRHQVMPAKQIPAAGTAPGIISSAVLQVQQTQTFGPFSSAPLANPAPSTNQAFSIRPGASNTSSQAPTAEPHSGPKSTALSTEAAPQPSGFDNNTTAEPRNQHGIVEKVESSSESEQSNEDDLYSHEPEPAFVQLEVGGRTFQVHAATFDLYPDSKLYKIIHYAEAGSQNLSGAYTFDRDGNMFEVILSFARTGRLDLPPYYSLKAIEREAEFFGMKEYMFGQGKQVSPGSYFSFRRTLKLEMELQPGNDRQFQCIAVLDSVDTLTFEGVVCEGFCHLLMEAVDLTGILIGRKIIFDSQDPNAWKGTQHSYEQKPVTVYLILIRKPSGGQAPNSTTCKASITYSTVFTFDTESHLPGFYRR